MHDLAYIYMVIVTLFPCKLLWTVFSVCKQRI